MARGRSFISLALLSGGEVLYHAEGAGGNNTRLGLDPNETQGKSLWED